MSVVRRAFAKKLCALVAGAWLAAGGFAAEPPPTILGPVADGVVELPPLEVNAQFRTTTPWQYVALPGFEILTRCPESLTREFVQSNDRIEQLFAAFVPPEFQVKFATPKLFVLSDQKSTPGASQDLIGGFEGGANENSGAAAALPGLPAVSVRFIPNMRLNDVDMLAVFAILEANRFDGDHISLTRDHMRFVLASRTPSLPVWLLQGLVGLCQTVAFEREALVFPPASWVSEPEERNIRNDSDYPRTLLPMRDLFDVRSLIGLEPRSDAVRRWQAQVSLFVRWAIDGNDPRRRQAFWKFAALACTERPTEAMFREHFGMGYSDLRDRLSDYLPVALKNTIRLRPEKITKLPVPKLRLATDAEIGRIKGDWERLEIAFVKATYPQYASRYEEQASQTLTKAYTKNPHDLALQAVIALNECDGGRDEQARPFLEAAAASKMVRPRIYVELARVRSLEASAHPAGANGLLDAAQTATVFEPLMSAFTQLPPLVQAYDLAADVWGRSEVRLAPAQLALLDDGVRLFPANLGLLYHVALVKVNQGLDTEAAMLVERGLMLTTAAAAKARFEKLRAVIAGRRAPPPKPAATGNQK